MNIDEVDFVLEEVAVVLLWDLGWLLFVFVAEINLDRPVVSETSNELVVVLSLCICDRVHVLLGSDGCIISRASTMVLFDNWVKAVEE